MERLTKGMSKTEIEKELSKWGDYVKIDNLTRFLKVNPELPLEIKKFVYQKLADIYESRKMFSESAKCYEKIIPLEQSAQEKIKRYTKTCEMYIKAEMFDRASLLVKNISENLSIAQRAEMNNALINCYKKEASECLGTRKSRAAKIYEKMLLMDIVPQKEKEAIREELLKLYLKIGKLIEYNNLKNKPLKKEAQKEETEEEIEGMEFLYK